MHCFTQLRGSQARRQGSVVGRVAFSRLTIGVGLLSVLLAFLIE
jgi:predicted N-acetyltransferase YhbS